MNRFDNKSVLVTGSTGIAAATARALHEEGARVFVVSRTAEHVDDLLRQLGPTCAGRRADLTDEQAVDELVAELVGTFGRLDCVYNVAGGSGRKFGDGPLHEMTLDGWNYTLATNATSQFLVCRAAIKQMLQQGDGGAILNMSSTLARYPEREHFATHGYAASKGAIESVSRALAAYYAPHSIRVNVIAPGLVATPMSQRAQADPGILAYTEQRQPLSHGILNASDLTGAALFLLSDEARMITGQVLDVDGGWSVSHGSSTNEGG